MFNSWRSYIDFQRSVMRDRRYIPSSETEEFLNAVRATAGDRSTHLKKGSIFWRAQLGHTWRKEGKGDDSFEVPSALALSRMKPLVGRASEGRANPKGIPVLYLANTMETAAAEVRPWIGSYISLAQFETNYKLQIVDCSHNQDDPSYHHRLPFQRRQQLSREDIEKTVWSSIDKSFARPVGRRDDVAAYVPTQIIAEVISNDGYDGLAYRSRFGDRGYTIALFDIDAASPINCQLRQVDSVKITLSTYYDRYSATR